MSSVLKHRFRDEIQILPSEEAAERIREHPDCPFRHFAFVGECEMDRVWYYIAGNGPVFDAGTQVVLLEKG